MKQDAEAEKAAKKKRKEEASPVKIDWGEFAKYVKPFEWYGA